MDAFGNMPLRTWPALAVLTALCIPAYAETPAPVTAPAAQVTAEQLAVEREFWASVKASGDPADIRAYLEQYPDGVFEALARNWLERLEEAAPRVSATSTVSTQAAAPAPRPSPQSVESTLGLTRAQRVQVQRGLAALGFDVGAADGVLGRRSRAAIAEWQSSRGEAATGYLDADAADILLDAGEAASFEPRRPADREAMQHLAEALSTAGRIDDAGLRARALSAIAKVQAAAGDTPGAARTIADVLTTARTPETARHRGWALGDVVEAQARTGDIERALSIARGIEAASFSALALGNIARVQAGAGDTRGAAQTLSEALTAVRRSQSARSRVRALAGIAMAQASTGDARGAARTLSEALAAARGIEAAFLRGGALNDVVGVQASTGDIPGALTTARGVEHVLERALALAHVAGAQSGAGDPSGAARTVSEALATARTIKDATQRAPALRGVAGAQAIAGDIQAALATTRTIVNAYNRAWALRSIAEAQAIAGDIDRALTTTREYRGCVPAGPGAQRRHRGPADCARCPLCTGRRHNAAARPSAFQCSRPGERCLARTLDRLR